MNPCEAARNAIVTPLHQHVREVNNLILTQLPGKEYVFRSADTFQFEHGGERTSNSFEDVFKSTMTAEYLNSLDHPNVPPHELCVKVGAICFILRNLNKRDRLMNGTKIEIVAAGPYFIRCGRCDDSERRAFSIPRITFRWPLPGTTINIVRRQYPVVLCYCMTLNKVQSQSVGRLGLYLPVYCFSHGHLYNALARVGGRDYISCCVPPDRIHNGAAIVRNIVYPELLMHSVAPAKIPNNLPVASTFVSVVDPHARIRPNIAPDAEPSTIPRLSHFTDFISPYRDVALALCHVFKCHGWIESDVLLTVFEDSKSIFYASLSGVRPNDKYISVCRDALQAIASLIIINGN